MRKDEESLSRERFEKCVICGKTVPIRKDTPIKLRKTYLPGAGQLCEACCWKIYGTNDLRPL